MGADSNKQIIKITALSFICTIVLLISYVFIVLTVENHKCKKQALTRIEQFLSEYRSNNIRTVRKFNAELDAPLSPYKCYKYKFISIKDTGDGDPIYRVVFYVKLINDKTSAEYEVEQAKYGDWDMKWTKK